MPFDEIQQAWKTAIDDALNVDPDDANALGAKAMYLIGSTYDWKGALPLWSRSVGRSKLVASLYPGGFLVLIGDWQGARQFYEAALINDPYNVDTLLDVAFSSHQQREYESALKYWERILTITPGMSYALAGKANTLALLGHPEEASRILETIELRDLNPFGYIGFFQAAEIIGETPKYADKLEAFRHLAITDYRYRAPYALTLPIYGNADQAMAAQEQLFKEHNWGVLYLLHLSLVGPRYDTLRKKLNLDDQYLSELDAQLKEIGPIAWGTSE